MSAEGVLADPCIFYNAHKSLCSCTSLVDCVCVPDKNNSLDILKKEKMKDFHFGENESKNKSKYENENSNEVKNENIDKNIFYDNIATTKSNLLATPDRNALFCEYCVLSGMFFSAGGWHNLGLKDITFDFDENNDSGQCSLNCNDGIVMKEEDVIKDKKKEKEKENEKEKEGVEKQIEVARQHLYWMLEKKGHGRTVRFVHRGTYARHTDLLNDLKSAHTLEDLQLISKICLSNVFGSSTYINDNYDDN